jgi:hypothetical protein
MLEGVNVDFRIGLKFDAVGWEARGLHGNVLVWNNALGDGLGLYQFDLAPDLPAPLEDVKALLEGWPDAENGVILREVVELDGLLTVKAITKHRQTPTGMTYVGSWIIPRAKFSYVIKLQCEESGITGLREAVTINAALADGRIDLSANGGLSHWTADSSAEATEVWKRPNLAESEALDADFPDHPLSRVRRFMGIIEPSIRIEDFVKRAPPFTSAKTKNNSKPWWHRFLR